MKHKNIILDLDETLIHAYPSEEFDIDVYKKKFTKNLITNKDPFKFHDMDGYYIVFERPGLQDFLSYIFKNFNVSIWTAATKDYALFIIKNIILHDPSRYIDFVFFSYHCEFSKKYGKNRFKDLNILWDIYKLPGYSQKNTLIIDDHKDVYKTQPSNCIIASEFCIENNNSINDSFLKNIISLLDEFRLSNDIPLTLLNKINQSQSSTSLSINDIPDNISISSNSKDG